MERKEHQSERAGIAPAKDQLSVDVSVAPAAYSTMFYDEEAALLDISSHRARRLQ